MNHIVFDFQWGTAPGHGNSEASGPSPDLTAFVDALTTSRKDTRS
jgi:hypothetical protein